MSVIGLSSGFVPFGTVAHQVLTTIYECGGYWSLPALVDALPECNKYAMSTTVKRLIKYRFLYVVGTERPAFGRQYRLYGLKPMSTRRHFVDPLPAKERTRVYRNRKSTNETFRRLTLLGQREGVHADQEGSRGAPAMD